MYTDKDFQNRTNYGKKEESTGLITLNASGRGVADEYQLNESDLPTVNDHTITLSYSNNPLSFNDSGNWKEHSHSQSQSRPPSVALTRPPSNQPAFQTPSLTQISRPSVSPARKVNSHFSSPNQVNLFSAHPTSESIVIGGEPPARRDLLRREGTARDSLSDEFRYLIRSKNKTMEELSLKQSMVVGFDHYYQ